MATIKDVAKKAGVSSSSVSRILNNDLSLNVPQSTRERVIEAAQALGYVKKKKKINSASLTIGIVTWISPVQEIEDPYYMSIRQGVENYCVHHKISIERVFATDPDFKRKLDHVDGIAAIGKFSKEKIDELLTYCPNTIFLDMNLDPITACCITLDFKSAIRNVISAFQSEGHLRIGYLGGKEYLGDQLYQDQRLKYFLRFSQRAGLTTDGYIYEGEFSTESGYTMMSEMIESGNIPTAVFAASDPIAIGAMRAIRAHHLRIPEDISIIGFDNIETTQYTDPPLTTVFAPTYDIGNTGMRMLHDACLRNENLSPMRISIPCYLVLRESTRLLQKAAETNEYEVYTK